MRKREKDTLHVLLGKEQVLFSEKVRFEVGIGTGLRNARLLATGSRLLFARSTPMGFQATIIWHKDVESFTTGKKKGQPYLQLLGNASRVLIVFKSKSIRERFKEVCLKEVAG